MTGSPAECDDFDECFTKNLMINAISSRKMTDQLSSINMNGTNLKKTNVGVDLTQNRMNRIRMDAEVEVIEMKAQLENEMLMNVVNSEEELEVSMDAMYTDRNNSAQAALVTMLADFEGRKVCIGSCLVKRQQHLSTELAKTAPGIVVDLHPKQLEGYGDELLLKRLVSATKRKFSLCTGQCFTDLILSACMIHTM